VPDDLLKLPRNLIAYAYADGATVKSVKFAVVQRPMPSDYISDQSEELYEVERRLELLEAMLKDIELGNQEMQKFETIEDASKWAQDNKMSGTIIVIHIDTKWIAHIVEDDYSVTPICNCNGEMVEIDIYDGGDSDGHEDVDEIQIWDGGGAAGI
jgi:membrane carboxypeptidase/penicillin-binding protein